MANTKTGKIQLSINLIDDLAAHFDLNKEHLMSVATVYVSVSSDISISLVIAFKNRDIFEVIYKVNSKQPIITSLEKSSFCTNSTKNSEYDRKIVEFPSFNFSITDWLRGFDDKFLKDIKYVSVIRNCTHVAFYDKNKAKRFFCDMKAKKCDVKFSDKYVTFVEKN